MKQTLEATYNPGPLLLNGPNVKFTSAEQLLSRTNHEKPASTFHISIAIAAGSAMTTSFKQNTNKSLGLEETTYYNSDGESFRLFMDMPKDEIQSVYARAYWKAPLSCLFSSISISVERKNGD